MSKISYCSLEEAWGNSYSIKDENKDKEKNKYDYLNINSDIQRTDVIKNMNNIERNNSTENNLNIEYQKYRFNPINSVSNNNYDNNYTPFKESVEKKYLQDKLNFLENQIMKYDMIIENSDNEKKIKYENFSNQEDKSPENNQYQSNDIIDLIILIIIGLIIIFIMNSIFNIGKSIGAKNKVN